MNLNKRLSTPFAGAPAGHCPVLLAAVALALLVAVALPGCSVPPTATPRLEARPAASLATTAAEYRQDAARHLYAHQAQKIYQGRLPPMLYAVGVLQLDIDRDGRLQTLQWRRAPSHAPEVMAEIEAMVRAAAPFPAPSHLGKVSYTDVWLWHRSGQFQLDTLTEGQD